MQIQIDREQAEVLHDILASSLNQLKIESARTDSTKYRQGLHHREHVVAELLAKLDVGD